MEGWVVFVIKEKFKLIKSALKSWHQNHTKNLSGRISSLQERISLFDCKGGNVLLFET